jgi:hypothetical protein
MNGSDEWMDECGCIDQYVNHSRSRYTSHIIFINSYVMLSIIASRQDIIDFFSPCVLEGESAVYIATNPIGKPTGNYCAI